MDTSWTADLKVGDSVFVAYSQRYLGKPRPAIVEKVGRKWVFLDCRAKFKKGGFALDGGDYMSPGRVWRNESEYLSAVERDANWRAVLKILQGQYTQPDWFPDDLVRAIIAQKPDHSPE